MTRNNKIIQMIQNNNYKGGTTMYKKLTLYLALFLVCMTSVFAANTITLHYYDEDSNAVDNVEVVVYECSTSSCSALESGRVDSDDTGSTNDAVLSIPGVSSTTWFVAYAFAEESDSYLPNYQTFYLTGDGYSGATDVTLEKKDICRSTIQSFSVTNSAAPNEPIYVDVEAALEADTYSAFEYSDSGIYAYGDGTSTYGDWFTAETLVSLSIVKEITIGANTISIPVYSDTETLNIQAADSENVQFSYTPTSEGTYVATVSTYVTDAQCASAEEQSSSEQFEIVSEEDTEYCYTLIDNLAIQEIEDGTVTELQTGVEYTVTFDKLSNSVDSDGDLDARDTALDVTVYDDDGDLDYSFSDVDGNTNTDYDDYSFSWTPISGGDNTIVVYGIADNCAYSENIDETETLTIYVAGDDIDTTYPPVADAGGSFFGMYWSTDYDVTFDGSGSYDTNPDGSGSIVSYEWDFGDGSTRTGVSPTHTYSATGTYTATLTVTDNDGLTDDDTATVRIWAMDFPEIPDLDFDPIVTCGGPYSATLGESITFDGYGFDADGGIIFYTWDFGDGSTSVEEDPTYTYSAEGVYTVTLTVLDDEGNSAVCTTTATITAVTVNSAPTVDCSVLETAGTVDEILTLDVDATDSDGTIAQ